MSRKLITLIQEVREILRAEGTDAGGFSDFAVLKGINAGLIDMSEIYPIRDTLEFNTTDDINEYDLSDKTIAPHGVTDIVRVVYGGSLLRGMHIDDFLSRTTPVDEGGVNHWVLWGQTLTLIGKVTEKPVKIFITRPAKELTDFNDTPETPPVADRALVQYAVAICFQEARDLENYSAAMNNYYRLKNSISLYGSPRGQRDTQNRIRDSYWQPVRGRSYYRRSDTKPH